MSIQSTKALDLLEYILTFLLHNNIIHHHNNHQIWIWPLFGRAASSLLVGRKELTARVIIWTQQTSVLTLRLDWFSLEDFSSVYNSLRSILFMQVKFEWNELLEFVCYLVRYVSYILQCLKVAVIESNFTEEYLLNVMKIMSISFNSYDWATEMWWILVIFVLFR